MKSNNQLSQNDALIEKLTRIVLNNLQNEQFGVSELSKLAGISRSYLHRKLTLIRNQSISQFIREIRLQEAFKLLNKEGLTASEVAYEVGFKNPTYFSTCFHEHFGFPPGELIQQRRIENTKTETSVDIIRKKSMNVIFTNRVLKIISLSISILLIFFIVTYFVNRQSNQPSIAVLPFNTLSSEVEIQYLADAIVDNILYRLSGIKELEVKSRVSSDKMNATNLTSREIAKELGVSYILTGSIIPENGKIRINVQLISAIEDDYIWARYFDKDLKGIHSFISEVSKQITEEISILFLPENKELLNTLFTNHEDAYNLYLEGRFYYRLKTKDNFLKSIALYQEALSIDSNFCLAYAGIADSYITSTWYGFLTREEGVPKSREYALKALSINKNLAEPHVTLGGIATYFDYDWNMAGEELQMAIELKPDYARAYKLYSELMDLTGNKEQARKYIDKAIELEPSYAHLLFYSCYYYYKSGEFEKAFKEVEKAFMLNNDKKAYYYDTFMIYLFQKEYLKAINEYKKFLSLQSQPKFKQFLEIINSETNYIDAIQYVIDIEEERGQPLYYIARYYAIIDKKNDALDYLEKSYQKGEGWIARMKYEIAFKDLTSEPRFIELLRNMNLDDN